MNNVTLELSREEAQLAVMVLSRGCAHIGAEVSQTGANVAPQAGQMLVGASEIISRINNLLKEEVTQA